MLREVELFQTAAACRQLSVQVSMVAWRMGPGPERSRVEGYCQRLELHAIDLENQAAELADSYFGTSSRKPLFSMAGGAHVLGTLIRSCQS
jgi:hypothetical protein